jgi:hypothetical protein
MTRREWLELKSRVKITRGDNYLLIAFWVSVVSRWYLNSLSVWGLLPEDFLNSPSTTLG